MEYRKNKKTLSHLISMPIIWLPLPFIIMLDIICELYHQTCFPLYGIQKVKRSEYIKIIDRSKLPYLNFIQKFGCMYCGYANGWFLYIKEIAGRTEKYWCGIMHEDKPGFKTQEHQIKYDFAKFGNEEEFRKKYPQNK